MIKTVLFDLDGTLLDSEPDFTSILNAMLAEKQRPGITTAQVRETISNGARALVGLGFDVRDGEDGFEQALAVFLDHYHVKLEGRTEARLFPGVAALLQRLEQRRFPWGIVTNKSSRFTLPLMQQLPPLDQSWETVCSDHVSQGKPDPEGLLLACRGLQCLPGEAVYVGDHPRDIEAGALAGMTTIAVTWGYLPPASALHTWGADHVVETPDEIEQILFS